MRIKTSKHSQEIKITIKVSLGGETRLLLVTYGHVKIESLSPAEHSDESREALALLLQEYHGDHDYDRLKLCERMLSSAAHRAVMKENTRAELPLSGL